MGLFDLLSVNFFRRAPTEERLAREIIANAPDRADWEFDPLERQLRNTKSRSTMSLVNILLEYQNADASTRPRLLEKYRSMLHSIGIEIPKLWTLAQKSIYPIFRTRFDTLTPEILQRGSGNKWPARPNLPWHGDVVRRIAYDLGSSTQQVNSGQLENWGVTPEDAWDRAVQNLRALPKPEWVSAAPGVWRIVTDFSYEESMLLRADVRAALQVRGAPLYMMVNRGVLLATGADEPDGIAHLTDLARHSLLNNPWPLPPLLLGTTETGFAIATVSADLQERLDALRKIDLAGTYNEQRDALEKWCEDSGQDFYVAKLEVQSTRDNPHSVRTLATWSAGVDTWLPRSDVLLLNREVDGKNLLAIVTWQKVAAICGPLLRKLDEDPERYEVRSFPDDAQWKQLLDGAEWINDAAKEA